MRAFIAAAVFAFTAAACNPARESTGPSTNDLNRTTGRTASADELPLSVLACGAQITGDVRLANDLACVGNALLVSGDGLTIDLNGHTLAGNGSGNGITITASHDVTISGGTIRGFQSGIFANGTTAVVIRDNEFSATNQAVLLQATTGAVIKHNAVTGNLARAFMLRPNLAGGLSTENLIIGNVVRDTPTGVYLIRQPGNTILNNTIVGATIAAIDLAEGPGEVSGNIIRANHLADGGAGIRLAAGWIANTIVGNRIEANVCGTKGSTAGNALNGNVFSDNGSDACP
jgi:parallel beta-helix repeat protein